MTDRCQLNLRLDGSRDLLETIKDVAAAEGLSVNTWVIRTLEMVANQAISEPTPQSRHQESEISDIEPVLDTLLDALLDTLLAAKLAGIEERLGNLRVPATRAMNRERLELKVANKQLTEWDAELNQLHDRNGDLVLKVQMLEQELKFERRSRSESKNSAPTVAEFAEPADLLNQMKARRKKSGANLADMEAVLEILGNH
jgi:hypothetical protein